MNTFFSELTARAKRLLCCLVLCTSALVAACGGGSGADNTPPPYKPPVREATELLYGYFAVADNQIAETADHVNVVLVPDWGPWDDPAIRTFIAERMIQQLQEADARGIRKFVVSIGVFVYTSQARSGALEKFTPRNDMGELIAFRQRLESLGLADKVIALYPVDEPELHDLNDQQVTAMNAAIRQAWPGPSLAVIYGDTRRYPGISSYDWYGIDNYGAGAGVLKQYPTPLPGQRTILVPGSADPWAHDPQPFLDYALSHPEVLWICPFVWFDGFEGTNKGARSNSRTEDYRAVGRRIKG